MLQRTGLLLGRLFLHAGVNEPLTEKAVPFIDLHRQLSSLFRERQGVIRLLTTNPFLTRSFIVALTVAFVMLRNRATSMHLTV